MARLINFLKSSKLLYLALSLLLISFWITGCASDQSTGSLNTVAFSSGGTLMASEVKEDKDKDSKNDEDEDEDEENSEDKNGGKGNDGNTNDNTPRTFVMSDLSPFPKKDELVISDKEVSKPFSVYLYIVTNGEAYKQHSAYSINITLVDETNGTITPIRTSLTIEEDIGYVVIDNIKYDLPARVHFHIEGIITKNKKDLFVSVDSNSFNIVGGQDPGGGQVPSDNNLIWEQEEVI